MDPVRPIFATQYAVDPSGKLMAAEVHRSKPHQLITRDGKVVLNLFYIPHFTEVRGHVPHQPPGIGEGGGGGGDSLGCTWVTWVTHLCPGKCITKVNRESCGWLPIGMKCHLWIGEDAKQMVGHTYALGM